MRGYRLMRHAGALLLLGRHSSLALLCCLPFCLLIEQLLVELLLHNVLQQTASKPSRHASARQPACVVM